MLAITVPSWRREPPDFLISTSSRTMRGKQASTARTMGFQTDRQTQSKCLDAEQVTDPIHDLGVPVAVRQIGNWGIRFRFPLQNLLLGRMVIEFAYQTPGCRIIGVIRGDDRRLLLRFRSGKGISWENHRRIKIVQKIFHYGHAGRVVEVKHLFDLGVAAFYGDRDDDVAEFPHISIQFKPNASAQFQSALTRPWKSSCHRSGGFFLRR